MKDTLPKITKFDVHLGKVLKYQRQGLQMSQRQLAKLVRNATPIVINQSRISTIESGQERVTLVTFLALCKALQLKPVTVLAQIPFDFSPVVPDSDPVVPQTKPHTPRLKVDPR